MSSKPNPAVNPSPSKHRGWAFLFGLAGLLWLAFFLITHYRSGQFGFAWVLLAPQKYWTAEWQPHLWRTLPGLLLLALGAFLLAKNLRLRLGFLLVGFLGATLLPEAYCGIQDLQFRAVVRADLESTHSEERWWPNPVGNRIYYRPNHPIQARNTPRPE